MGFGRALAGWHQESAGRPACGDSRTRRPTAVRGEGSGPLFFLPVPRPAGPGCNEEAREMAWIYLLVAGLFEVVWAVGLKYTEGWTRPWPSAGTLVAMAGSFWFPSQALKSIPIGIGRASCGEVVCKRVKIR